MKVYEVSTDCLVDFCMLRWHIKAKSMREAWCKGWQIIRNCNVADEGGMDVVRITDYSKIKKITEVTA